eukprot:1786949-Pleurochrysis_carterae.AAC.1
MEAFLNTSLQTVTIRILATKTKILTGGQCTRAHAEGCAATPALCSYSPAPRSRCLVSAVWACVRVCVHQECKYAW